MKKADTVTKEIMHLFEDFGNEDYDGEPVSQTSHMIQCAMEAMGEGEDMELILGAFLHDVGHLLRHEQQTNAMGNYGVANHEGLGGEYLRRKSFSERVCAMVEKHVDAKRYLVATDPLYKDKLSEASLQTLNMWQGGPMSETEIILFKQHPYFDDIIKVRLWDEAAKSRDAVMLPLDHFRNLIYEYLNGTH
ncbi:MAG: HD domain-containing protein [Panacibacter sp.]